MAPYGDVLGYNLAGPWLKSSILCFVALPGLAASVQADFCSLFLRAPGMQSPVEGAITFVTCKARLKAPPTLD
eukprot:1145050-Pelagomonas_calceolata.AAC.2